MSGQFKLCGALNTNCAYLHSNGVCWNDSFECSKMLPYKSGLKRDDKTLIIMQNLRELHKENMELKELLLELKQNQK